MSLRFREFTSTADPSEIKVSFVDYITNAVAMWDPASQELQFSRYDDALKTVKHKWYIGDSLLDLPDNAGVDDYFTVALHEIGHIVGLDHQSDIDDIMYTLAGRGDVINSSGFSAFRSFSQDDILGARDLYSIPIPEPASLALLGMGVAALLQRRRMSA